MKSEILSFVRTYLEKNHIQSIFLDEEQNQVFDLGLREYLLKEPKSIQVGQNVIVGLTVGYHFTFTKHWGLEIVAGYGRQFSTYEAYTPHKDGTVLHRELNGSAEYLPTKAGVLVTYRF